jgi:hypothetical protein
LFSRVQLNLEICLDLEVTSATCISQLLCRAFKGLESQTRLSKLVLTNLWAFVLNFDRLSELLSRMDVCF